MDIKKIMLATLLLLAVLTIGAVSAADNADFNETLTVEDTEEVSLDAPLDENTLSESGDEEIAADSESDVISDEEIIPVINDGNVTIHVEDGIENEYNISISDNLAEDFAWVLVPNGLTGNVTIFVENGDEKVYYLNNALTELKNITNSDNEGFTYYYIAFNGLTNVLEFAKQKNFTLAFVNGEKIVNSQVYNIEYNDTEKIIKFFEAKNDEDKPDYPITISVNDITYGEELGVLISAYEDYEVYIILDDDEGTMMMVQIENGTYYWNITDLFLDPLNSGIHWITVKFPGNDKYAETIVNKNFTVNKANSTISVENVTVNSSEFINVPFSVDGAKGINASVVGYPDVEIIYLSNGIRISGLAVGNYTLKVVTIVDENHNSAEATAKIVVNKVIVTNNNFRDYFNEAGELITDADELYFTDNFADKNFNIKKPVTLIGENANFNNVRFNIYSDDVTIKNMKMIYGGELSIIYVEGVKNFILDNNEIIFSLNINHHESRGVVVNNSNNVIIKNNNIRVHGRFLAEGVLISDSNFTVVSNIIYIDAGRDAQGINIIGSGNGTIENNNVSATANVTSFGMNTTLSALTFSDILFVKNIIICEAIYAVGINDDSERISGNDITLKAVNSIGVIVNSENAEISDNTIKLIFRESETSATSSAIGVQANKKTKILKNTIESFDKSISLNDGSNSIISGNKLNAPITVATSGNTISGNEINTNKDSAIILSTQSSGNKVENNVLSANGVSGNDAISNQGTENNILNNKANPRLAIGNIADIAEGQSVVIVIMADANFTQTVNVKVGSYDTTASLTKGTGKVTIPADKLSVGNVTVTVTFAGNDKYTNGTANTTFVVKANVATLIKATVAPTTYGTSTNIVVTLTDANGIALNGKDVTILLNGASKTLKTDYKGQATFDVGTALVPNTYDVSITFDGDANYTKSSGSVKVVVKKATPKLTAKMKTFKVKKAKKYTIVLKTDKNKALSKAKVTIIVKSKGKTVKVTAKTSAKGKATFNLKKLNKKGKYTATVKFAGDKLYNEVSKKVKITVKK